MEIITSASRAKGRFTPGGSVSFFQIKMREREKEIMMNVMMEPALLIGSPQGLNGCGQMDYQN
jgi:hypothetical protein